jgi:hypothetical protein
VSIESLNDDLAQLERDVRALSQDTGRLVGSVTDRARTVEEEIVAAEFIATEETIETVSGWLAALSDIGTIQSEQLKIFFADHRQTLQSRSPIDLLRLGYEHWNRRATHIAEGLGKTVGVLTKEGRHMTRSAVEMWKPLIELVRGDWARR